MPGSLWERAWARRRDRAGERKSQGESIKAQRHVVLDEQLGADPQGVRLAPPDPETGPLVQPLPGRRIR